MHFQSNIVLKEDLLSIMLILMSKQSTERNILSLTFCVLMDLLFSICKYRYCGLLRHITLSLLEVRLDVRFWCRRNGVQTPSRSNLPHVANNSPLLRPWYVDAGAKPRRWAPLTRDTL